MEISMKGVKVCLEVLMESAQTSSTTELQRAFENREMYERSMHQQIAMEWAEAANYIRQLVSKIGGDEE